MNNNTRVFSGFLVFFWLSLLIEIILLELTSINSTALIVLIIISTAGTITALSLFIVKYYRSKNSVAKLKEEYLESLKPQKPLRFCASDDELMKAYKQSASEVQRTFVSDNQIKSQKPKEESQKEVEESEEISM